MSNIIGSGLYVLLDTEVNALSNLINLQDGSYSRGPVDIPVGDTDDSKYYLSPTFKFEQVSFHGIAWTF